MQPAKRANEFNKQLAGSRRRLLFILESAGEEVMLRSWLSCISFHVRKKIEKILEKVEP